MHFEGLFKDRHRLWSLLAFEGIYFWRPLNFEWLILEIYRKYNPWAIYQRVITLWFYNFTTKNRKKKNKISEKRR